MVNGKVLIDKQAIAKKISNFKQLASSNKFKFAGNNLVNGKINLNLHPNFKQRQLQKSSQSFTLQNCNSFASQQQQYRLNVSSAQNTEPNPEAQKDSSLYYSKANNYTNTDGIFVSSDQQLNEEAGFYSPSNIDLNIKNNLEQRKGDNFSQSTSNKYFQYYHQEQGRQYKNSRNIFSRQNNSSLDYPSKRGNIGDRKIIRRNTQKNNDLAVVVGGGVQPIITTNSYSKPLQITRLGTKLFKNMVFNMADYKNSTYHQQQSRLIAVARKPIYNNTTLLDDVNQGDKIQQIYGSKVLDALTLDFNPKSQTLFHCNNQSDLVNHQEQKLTDYQLNYESNCSNELYHHQREGGGAFDINMYQSGVCFLTGQQSIAHFGEYQVMMMLNKNQKNVNSSCYTGRQHGRIIKLNSGLFITQTAIDMNSLKNSTNVPDMRSRGFFFGQQQQQQQQQGLQQQLQHQIAPQSQFKFNSCRLSQKVVQNQANNLSGVNKNLKIATIKNTNSIYAKSGTQKSTTEKFSKFMKGQSGGNTIMGKKFLGQNYPSQIGDRRTQKWN